MMHVWFGLLASCGAPEAEGVAPASPPVDLPQPASQRTAPTEEAVRRAMDKAIAWMQAYDQPVRFDAILAASQLGTLHPTADAKRLFEHRLAGLSDTDHPHIRLWDPTHRLPDGVVPDWTADARARVNVNRVLTEALHCSEHGWRAQTTEYVCGAMRDNGGYHTTHGLWALTLAQERDCIESLCTAALVDEIAAAQPAVFQPNATLDIDLYAERLLTSCLANSCGAEADRWVATLLALQQDDGGWRVPKEPEPLPYADYHTTMIAAWALAVWSQRQGAAPSP